MSRSTEAATADTTFEDNDATMTASHHTLPLAAIAIPLCAAQLLGARHMRGQVMKLLRDPHVWLPWRNRSPWKNPTNAWWWNAKPWLNQQVVCSFLCYSQVIFILFHLRSRGKTPARGIRARDANFSRLRAPEMAKRLSS